MQNIEIIQTKVIKNISKFLSPSELYSVYIIQHYFFSINFEIMECDLNHFIFFLSRNTFIQ